MMSKAKNIILGSFVFPFLLISLGAKIGIPTANMVGLFYYPLTYLFLFVHIPLVLLITDHIKRNTNENKLEIGSLPFWIFFTFLGGIFSVLSYWFFTYKLPNNNNKS